MHDEHPVGLVSDFHVDALADRSRSAPVSYFRVVVLADGARPAQLTYFRVSYVLFALVAVCHPD